MVTLFKDLISQPLKLIFTSSKIKKLNDLALMQQYFTFNTRKQLTFYVHNVEVNDMPVGKKCNECKQQNFFTTAVVAIFSHLTLRISHGSNRV
jgi:hypothetical protein